MFGPIGALVSIPVIAAVQAVIETYGRRYELIEEAGAPPAERKVRGEPPKQREASPEERLPADREQEQVRSKRERT